jgi:branched-chain amino acid transport system ATP-binding protein
MALALEIKNINTFYGYSHVIYDASLEVREATVVALLGRNGVGKTTMLRSIMGLTRAQSGEILFYGKDIRTLEPFVISKLGVGYVPQGRRLFSSLTVREHLEVYYRKGFGGGWDPEKALEFFPRLRERYTSKAGDLSGGERQMLAIARALVTNPKLIIMDEPTEGLAPMVVAEVGRLIKLIKEEGFTILLTEQKMKFALDLADESYILSKGQIVYHGLPKDLMSDEYTKKTYLGV